MVDTANVSCSVQLFWKIKREERTEKVSNSIQLYSFKFIPTDAALLIKPHFKLSELSV